MTSSSFQLELAAYGPSAVPSSAPSVSAARRYCRRLAKAHYENFLVATCLLPAELRPHFHAIYAYCRWADDLADETVDPQQALELLNWWEEQLRDCYARRATPTHPVFVALNDTRQEFRIPIDPFANLLVAFRQDQRQFRYRSWEELHAYCDYSANPVGHLVLYLGRCYDPQRARLADSICTGLQLANFWQDVARDWQRGRVYLPTQLRQEYGVEEEDLAADHGNPAFCAMLRAAVERAEEQLRAGEPLIELMPGPLRVDVAMFLRGGLAILDRIRRADYDVLKKRPTVSRAGQVRLLLASWWEYRWGPRSRART